MQTFYTGKTNYTDKPKANEQSKMCVLLHFLSKVLSSAKRLLEVANLKNVSYIVTKILYSLYVQTTSSTPFSTQTH